MSLALLFFKFSWLLLRCLTPNLPCSGKHAVLGFLASLLIADSLPFLMDPIKSHCLARRKTKLEGKSVRGDDAAQTATSD